MDGIYLPDGRQLALIDRDWILDELPHLGNPDQDSHNKHLLTSSVVANTGTGVVTTGPTARSGTNAVTGSTSSHGISATAFISTGHTAANHSLSYNPDESERELTLLSEVIDETQNKWSDFGLNQLLTPYTVPFRQTFK